MTPVTINERGRGARAPQLAFALIWISWLAVVLLLSLVRPLTAAPIWTGDIAVLLHSAVAIFIIARYQAPRIAVILGLSLALRTGLVFWDLNFSHILLLPNSGADTAMYYSWAVEVAKNPSMIFEDIRGGMYSKIIGLMFWLTGPLRVLGQYTNALLGLSIVLLLQAVMDRLPLSSVNYVRVLAVAALLPNTLIISAIFLRESMIAFLIAISAYFFVQWFRGGSPLCILLVAAAVLAASTFHAGVIAVGVGYMVVVLFYRRDVGRFGVSLRSVLYLALFALIMYFVVAKYPDLFLGKFEKFDSEADLVTSTNRRGGGSQYLTGLTVTSYVDMIRYGPLRALYFLASPMPWDWRGFTDLFTFAADSLFCIGVPIIFLVRSKRLGPHERVLGYALFVVIVAGSLVFGAGVSNAGTAVRHRFKMVSLLMLLMAVTATAVRRGGAAKRINPEGDRMDVGSNHPTGAPGV